MSDETCTVAGVAFTVTHAARTPLERTEFHVWFNGCEWCASVDGVVIATGQTPVSAIIAAELRVRRVK
jgi:hypothetical protein